MVSEFARKSGMTGVAAAATLSFVATSAMFCYVVFLSVVVRRDKDGSTSRPYSRAIRFLRTQSGRYFLNLVFSDMVQGLGFAFNYRWIHQEHIDMSGSACTFQGLAIQIGDVASALWVTTIAIHTMVTLALRKHPPKWTMYATIIFNWCFVAILAIVGPAALSKPHLGPFYAQAGGWCWINASYDEARLWLHYFFIFIAIAVNTICYSITFLILRHQAFKPSKTAIASSHSESISHGDVDIAHPPSDISLMKDVNHDEKASNGNIKCLQISIPVANAHPALESSDLSSPADPLSPTTVVDPLPSWLVTSPPGKNSPASLAQRRPTYRTYSSAAFIVERTARKMLWYPPVYLILCLPLAAYRLAGIAGHDWGFHAQIACGCIFSLAGFGNVSLYWVTRKMGPGLLGSCFKRADNVARSKEDEIRMRTQSFGTDVRSPDSLSPVIPREINGFGGTSFWDTWKRDPASWNDHRYQHNTYFLNKNMPYLPTAPFQKPSERQSAFKVAEGIHVETRVEMRGDDDGDAKEVKIQQRFVERNRGKISPIPDHGKHSSSGQAGSM